jgi:hypothetical protein
MWTPRTFAAVVLVSSLLAQSAEGGSGWYLLASPMVTRDGDSRDFDIDAPLHKWSQVGAYDTAKECADDQGKTIQKVLQLTSTAQLLARPRPQSTGTTGGAILAGMLVSVCVRSDDPRLLLHGENESMDDRYARIYFGVMWPPSGRRH